MPTICEHCEEEVLPEEVYGGMFNGKPVHRECMVRMVYGSPAHILKECACFGGTRPDPPPTLTKRQAARLSLDTFSRMMDKV